MHTAKQILIEIIVIFVSLDKLSDIKKKHNRESLVEGFTSLKTYSYNKMDDAIFERFIRDDSLQLLQMRQLLVDEKKLTEMYHKSVTRLKKKESIDILEPEMGYDYNRFLRSYEDDWYILNTMIEDGLIIKDKDNIVFNQPMKNTLVNFLQYLNENQKIGQHKYPIQKLFSV